MKKIKFYRNEMIYEPSATATALENAESSIMLLDDAVDGEIVLARYRESQDSDVKTLLCTYYDDGSDSYWTFVNDFSEFYDKGYIDDTEEAIAQSLSELDERVYNALTTAQAEHKFTTSLASSITQSDITKWNNKAHTEYVTVSAATSPITIEPYKMYDLGTINGSLTVVFDTTKEISGYTKEYIIRFVAGIGCNIVFPEGTLYPNGVVPTYTDGHTFEINVVNGCAVVGEFY